MPAQHDLPLAVPALGPRRARRRPPVTAGDFRRTAGLFATGVTVVTATHGKSSRGMTANSFTSVSLDPLLVLVCVRHDSGMRRLLDDAGTFAVSVLAADQQPVAAWFADPRRPEGSAQFDAVDWVPGPATGAPLLTGAVASIECSVAGGMVAGDHAVVLGAVLGVGSDPGDPLLFFAGGYGTAAPLVPAAIRAVGG